MANRLSLVVVVAVVVLLASAPAHAQRIAWNDPPPEPPRVDLSGAGGFLLSTDWSDLVLLGSVSPSGGVLEQVLVRDLVVDPGPVYDGAVTYWRGRYGFRAHAGFARSCLAVGRSCGDIASVTDDGGTVKVKSYSYDVGGAIGLIDYQPGRWAWPYVFFGLGGVTYDLDRTVGPPLTFIERRPVSAAPRIVGRDPGTVLITVDELGIETRLAFNIGVGTDFRVPLGPAGFGVRFELSDHIHDSPIDLAVTSFDGLLGPEQSRLNFGLVHNLRASVGVVLHFGR